jgi:hypothetical protein
MSFTRRGFGFPLVALGALTLACGQSADAPLGDAPVTVPENVGQVSQAVVGETTANSPESTELRFLPGLGYYDGTTCEAWPKTAVFGSGGWDQNSKLTDVIYRYSTGRVDMLGELRQLTQRMGISETPISRATIVGAKRELTLATGTMTLASGLKYSLFAVDMLTKQGFALDNALLCTEDDLKNSPLDCGELDAQLSDGTNVKVISRKAPRDADASLAVVVAAPLVRIAPSSPNGLLLGNVHLIIAADKVYGGAPYSPGEDVVARADRVTLQITPDVPGLAFKPATEAWRAALTLNRVQGLLAIFAGEVGGLSTVSAQSPATIERMTIGQNTSPANYVALTHDLRVQVKEYFKYTYWEDPVKHGQIIKSDKDIHLTWSDKPWVRTSGDKGATTVVVAGRAPSNLSVNAASPDVFVPTISRADVAAYVGATLDSLIQQWYTRYVFQGFGERIDGQRYFTEPAYRAQRIQLTVDELLKRADFSDSTSPHTALNVKSLNAAQARIGGQLLSHGALAEQMFARADNDSLRSGVVSPLWADAWKTVSNDSLLLGSLNQANLENDFGIAPSKHARASTLASSLLLSGKAIVKANALGLPYGNTTQGWYALGDQGASGASTSLLAAERRWNKLTGTVDSFQTAADRSFKVQSTAEKQAFLSAIGALKDGLSGSIDSTATAALTVSKAARRNAQTQQQTLEQLGQSLQRLIQLNDQLTADASRVFGCSPTAGGAGCDQAIQAKLDGYRQACEEDHGLDWFDAVVTVASAIFPAVAKADETVKKTTGKDIVDLMRWALKNFPPPGGWSEVDLGVKLTSIKDVLSELGKVEEYVKDAAKRSAKIRDIIKNNTADCPAGGQPQADVENFRKDVVLLDSLMQNYATQIGLVRTQVESTLGDIGFLTAQGDAFQKLYDDSTATKATMSGAVSKLQAQLSGPNLDYAQFQQDQRAFLDNACGVSLAAARTAQAELWGISQALESSTGRARTSPDLVVPASPAYHVASGQAGFAPDAQHFGFLVSLWDDAAFSSRLSSSGSSLTPSFLSAATGRFADLMTKEVCAASTTPAKPATRFVVRKKLTGKALASLIAQRRLDFSVGIDDVVAAGNSHTDGVRGVFAGSPSAPLPLAGAFVISAGYSVCKGPPGDECLGSGRVTSSQLGSLAGGNLNNLHLASRGHGFTPVASDDVKLVCDAGDSLVTSGEGIRLEGYNKSNVTTCLVSKTTPRISAGLGHWDDAGSPDTTLLVQRLDTTYCTLAPEALRLAPLQGLPLLGEWGLATSAEEVAALNLSAVAAPVNTALPDLSDATAVEVLFLVGAEPRGNDQPLSYSLDSLRPTPVSFADGLQLQGDATNIFPQNQVRLSATAGQTVTRSNPLYTTGPGSYTLVLRYSQPHSVATIAKIGIQSGVNASTLKAFNSVNLPPTGGDSWGLQRVTFNVPSNWPSSFYAHVQYVSGESGYLDAVWLVKN